MRKPIINSRDATLGFISDADAGAKRTNTTGRHIVVFRKNATEEGIKALESAGLKVVISNASDPNLLREDAIGDADVIVFATLGVALVGGDVEQILQLTNVASDSSSPLLTVKPEKVRYVLRYSGAVLGTQFTTLNHGLSPDYLRGYRSAVVHLEDELYTNDKPIPSKRPTATAMDESQTTWGLQVTNVRASKYSGRGIKVAILDTGFDFDMDIGGRVVYHPEFEGRTIVTQSFVPGAATAKDGHGHGTHCIGTTCGPRQPSIPPRYGIAYESEIYAGKVLSDVGSGVDGWIIAGIEWAINNGCQVISLSLGSAKEPGDAFNTAYEQVARRALDSGTLIIAAAGNDSGRPGTILPVSGPADCPSIMAVAALDSQPQVAYFSNGGINPNGGEVDVAAPGVSIYSSYLMPTRHSRKSGTSMAAPHVAGIAALYAEANPGVRGRALWNLIRQGSHQLPFSAPDVGAGLVQAP